MMFRPLHDRIVRRAMQAPVRQIAENAGNEGSVVVGKLLEKVDRNRGYDAQTGQFVDMFKAEIIDPIKVVRIALQDAGSIARAYSDLIEPFDGS